ncbi:DUF488 domain-containing protein [Rarobacter faecitabidus]|uniref:Uncharacterized protein YeaO (DUF488 family) n=1 Tax=Rarobacter faecitabidus TaxID=13243 RepID=A0A542ZUH4_RARFA|nr:DUF488 family protein [Rarobacter faecitabidus]TQL64015.1 uncharacterized protein YeaO (DUF488 family) [Rarobacter faecitabidus]
MPTIEIKRVYEAPTDTDGYRVLVDRLWPRGLSKERAHLDLWAKDAAPSSQLRRWWNHDPARMEEFAARYRAELDHGDLSALRDAIASHETATLLYAAHDPHVNHALILRDYLVQS